MIYDIETELNIGRTQKSKLLEKLVVCGVRFNKYTETLFSSALFVTLPETKQVRVKSLSVCELSLSSGGTSTEIFDAAKRQGLEPRKIS